MNRRSIFKPKPIDYVDWSISEDDNFNMFGWTSKYFSAEFHADKKNYLLDIDTLTNNPDNKKFSTSWNCTSISYLDDSKTWSEVGTV